MCLTDPPYGINEGGGDSSRGFFAKARSYENGEWDNDRASAESIQALISSSQNQIIWGGNYYADLLGASNCWLVWDKRNGATDFADCELAFTSFDSAVRIFRWRWQGMLQEKMGNAKEERFHPTQKPVALMKWCLENYSEINDTIVDPFAGSGTTGVAAKMLKRKCTLIEISEKFCEIAANRLNKPIPLFETPKTRNMFNDNP